MNALIHWNIICVEIGQRNKIKCAKMGWGGQPGGRSGKSFFHKFYRNSLHRLFSIATKKNAVSSRLRKFEANWKLLFMRFWTRQPFKYVQGKSILLWLHAASHALRVGRRNKRVKKQTRTKCFLFVCNVCFSFIFHSFQHRASFHSLRPQACSSRNFLLSALLK